MQQVFSGKNNLKSTLLSVLPFMANVLDCSIYCRGFTAIEVATSPGRQPLCWLTRSRRTIWYRMHPLAKALKHHTNILMAYSYGRLHQPLFATLPSFLPFYLMIMTLLSSSHPPGGFVCQFCDELKENAFLNIFMLSSMSRQMRGIQHVSCNACSSIKTQ